VLGLVDALYDGKTGAVQAHGLIEPAQSSRILASSFML
jgi:hypothetical protein